MSSPTITLSQRCESAISSLQNLSDDDSDWQPQLDATIQSLQNFLSITTKLTTILEDPDAFPGLVIDATNAAENASQASASLFKQIARLDAQNVSQVSSQYWTSLSVFLGAHSRLFAHFLKISSVDDDTQRANLEGPFYAELYQQTRQVADSASQCGDVFLGSPSHSQSTLPIHSKEQPAHDFDDQLPPSYSERDETTSPVTTPQAGSSSGNWFSSALSAVAGSFRAKPEPFVSALCQAVARGDITEARGLLRAGANINGVNEDRDTPLKTAIINGQIEAVEMLIEACADVNCTDGRDLPPLFLAAYLGRLQIAKLLLDAGARVDARSISHELYFSAMFSKDNNVGGARLLLNHGADPCSRNVSGQFIVATVVSKGRLDMLDMLLQRGAGANTTDITGQPLIAMAVRKNDIEMVKLLVKRGANANAKEISGGLVLTRAIQSDNMDMARLLLDRGAMPDARDSSNLVVLVDCAVKGKLEYVKLLLDRGAMSNATNLNGERVLISTIGAKLQPEIKVEIVRLLLEHGAWTQAKDCSGTNTAMMLARKQGNPELIKTLASFGAKD